jgi:autotransporter-associated beta strand protein
LGTILTASAATWNVNANGNWSDPANWSGGVADGAGSTASLTFNIYTALTPGPKTVTLDTTSRTVGILNIGDPSTAYWGYTLAASGGASLILDNGLVNAQINKSLAGASAAADTISAPLLLNNSLDISDNAPAGLLISGGVSVNSAGNQTLTNKGTGAYAAELSGILDDGSAQLAVTQNSATSTLILSGANTYTGTTTVSAGTLQLGNGGTSGSISPSSAIVNNGTLVFDRSDPITQGTDFNSVISGSGAVTQAGTGTTILDATNTFIGATTLTAGILSVSGDVNLGNANALVFNGGTLQVTGTAMTGFGTHTTSFTSTKTVGLDINDAANIFTVSQVLNQGTGGLTKSGAGTLYLTNINSYTGITTVSGGTLAYGVTNALSSGAVTVNGGILDLSSFSDSVGAVVLTSGSITGTTGVLTATSYVFDGTGTASAILAGSGTVTKSGAATTTTLTGLNTFTGATTLGSGILSVATIGNGGAASNLGAAATSAANLVFNGGSLEYTGASAGTNRSFSIITGKVAVIDVTVGASNLTISGAGAVTATTGALTKTGAGTLTFSGANTFTGLTTVSEGTLAYGITNALSSGAVTINGGTLDIASFNDTVGAMTLTSGSITGTTGILTGTSYALDGTGTVSAILGGAGVTLTKTNAGTVTLSGANTYTGLTTVSGGTFAYGIDNALSTGAVTVNGGILDISIFNDTVGTVTLTSGEITGTTGVLTGTSYVLNGTGTVSAILGGTATLTKTNAGTVTLSKANTYTGLTTVSNGTLALGIENALGSGAVTVSGGILDVSDFNPTVGAVTVASGSITGTGILTGAGYALTGTGTISAILGGSGSLTKTNTGTVILSGSNTYSGVTTISGGTLAISAIDNLGAASALAANLVFNGGTLQYTGAGTSTDRNFTLTAATTGTIDVTTGNLTISGASAATNGALTKTGAGTLTLAGANTHTGLTTVSGGMLAYGIDNALGSGAVTVNGGILDIASYNDGVGVVTLTSGSITGGTGVLTGTSYILNGTGTISAMLGGSGTLTKSGAATVTMSGVNSYAGATTLSAGTLKLGAAGTATHSPLGTTAAGTSVTSGAALDLNGITLGAAEALTLNGIGPSVEVSPGVFYNYGALINSSGTAATYAGLITLGSNSRIGATGGDINISNIGTISGAYDMRLEGSATDSSIASVIGIGVGGVYKSGTGAWTLSGANTYSGITRIEGGTLKLGSAGDSTNGPLGTTGGATGTQIGAALDLNGFSLGTAEPLTLRGTGVGSGGALTNSSATAATYKGPLTMEAAVSMVASGGDIVLSSATKIAGSAVQLTVGGAKNTTIQGNYGPNAASTLTKVGAGTLMLTGVNTYAGATSVNEGTLSVGAAGTINETSGISIGAGVFNYNSATALTKGVSFSGTGGTFSGSGTITPFVTVTADNTLAPGNSAGIMTFSGGLVCAALSHLQWELTDNLDTGHGSVFDGVNVTGGTFAIATGAVIDLKFGATVDFSNPFWDTNQTWVLVDLSGTVVGDGGTEVFTLGTTYSGPDGVFTITRVPGADTKNDVVLVWTAAVTETPFESWAKTNITDRDPAANASPGGDPDHDGASNLAEFAFNGDPLNSADNGFSFGLAADANGDSALELVLTVAVRKSAVFAAGSATSPVAEGIRYSIQGCYDLTGFSPSLVTPVDPAATIDPGVPLTDPANYEYRSFSLNGSSGLPGKGFLRATVTQE